VLEPTGIIVNGSTITQQSKLLKLNAELSRLDQQRSTADPQGSLSSSCSNGMVPQLGSMLWSKCTEGLRGAENDDLSLEPAHMDPCVFPPTVFRRRQMSTQHWNRNACASNEIAPKGSKLTDYNREIRNPEGLKYHGAEPDGSSPSLICIDALAQGPRLIRRRAGIPS